ncbi:MAG TPA: outer membrane lipoprotein-sorting protein [Candidatus Dormibacteraeota bacterium]|nr:outer membrane lipoprotein-sorting protein [Candidatus Dormibacteraeota bacterium]
MVTRSACEQVFPFSVLLLAAAAGIGTATAYSAGDILERAEAVRNPDGAYRFDMTITTSHPGQTDVVSSFLVYTNGRQQTLAYQSAPEAFAGRRMLMLERDAWLYLPGASDALHIFLRNVVTGEVASGDIARTDLSRQYTAALLREEDLDGTACYLLDLAARSPATTYSRILYWVSRKRFHPLKAEFYAVSGRRMKTGRFDEYREGLGDLRPTRLVLEDAGDAGYRSMMVFRNFRRVRLPDSLFVPEALSGMVRPPEQSGLAVGLSH